MGKHARREKSPILFHELTSVEQERCRQINLRLREIEAWAHARALAIAADLRVQVDDPDNLVHGFYILLRLCFSFYRKYKESRSITNFLDRDKFYSLGTYANPPNNEPRSGIGDLGHDYCIDKYSEVSDDPLQEDEAPRCKSFFDCVWNPV